MLESFKLTFVLNDRNDTFDHLLGDFDAMVDADENEARVALRERIDDLLDRKRSSKHSRQESITAYIRLLLSRYSVSDISSNTPDLISTLRSSVYDQTGGDEIKAKETILALQGLAATIVTDPREGQYAGLKKRLDSVIEDGDDTGVRATAIHTLAIAAALSGKGEIQDQMAEFSGLFSVESSSTVVTAGIQAWTFLATLLDQSDLEVETESAIDMLVEQLDKFDSPTRPSVTVNIAAGQALAYLYQGSIDDEESESDDEDDDRHLTSSWHNSGANSSTASPSDSDDEDEYTHSDDEADIPTSTKHSTSDPDNTPKQPSFAYKFYYKPALLTSKAAALQTYHSPKLSKKDKKDLHMAFRPIAETLVNPDPNICRVDWKEKIRIQALQRVLRGGLEVHRKEGNEAVVELVGVAETKVRGWKESAAGGRGTGKAKALAKRGATFAKFKG